MGSLLRQRKGSGSLEKVMCLLTPEPGLEPRTFQYYSMLPPSGRVGLLPQPGIHLWQKNQSKAHCFSWGLDNYFTTLVSVAASEMGI